MAEGWDGSRLSSGCSRGYGSPDEDPHPVGAALALPITLVPTLCASAAGHRGCQSHLKADVTPSAWFQAVKEVCLRAGYERAVSSPLLALRLRRHRQMLERVSPPVVFQLSTPERSQAARRAQRHSWVLQRVLHTLVLLGLQVKGQNLSNATSGVTPRLTG